MARIIERIKVKICLVNHQGRLITHVIKQLRADTKLFGSKKSILGKFIEHVQQNESTCAVLTECGIMLIPVKWGAVKSNAVQKVVRYVKIKAKDREMWKNKTLGELIGSVESHRPVTDNRFPSAGATDDPMTIQFIIPYTF